MPRYTYHCSECDKAFEIMHSMKEEQEECILCSFKGKLEKIPALIGALKPPERDAKVGDVVKDHIKQAKEDLREDKKSSRQEMEKK
tara:strand:+ start:376 stop:633 length:258 start_codon:yes stop_codon:yes gene_type:complete